VRLFHPRDHRWSDHFALKGPRIKPLTDVGKATVRLLDLNGSDRLLLRRALIKAGSYLSIEALEHIRS
jgi:hypothetical protein